MRMLFHCRNIVTIHTVPLRSDDATSYFSNGVKMSFLSVETFAEYLLWLDMSQVFYMY